jgi:type VI protein secretion system component Hcp
VAPERKRRKTMNLKTWALNKRPGRGIAKAASELYVLGMQPPRRILALTLGTLLAVALAGDAIAQTFQQIGTLLIPGVTQQPVPIFSAGVGYKLTGIDLDGGVATIGRAQFGVFTLKKRVDTTSPILLESLASGGRIQQASIDLFAPDGRTVLTSYQLTNIIVVGAIVNSVEDGKKRALIEEVSLDYTKIEQTVFTTSGPVEACWDRAHNTTC